MKLFDFLENCHDYLKHRKGGFVRFFLWAGVYIIGGAMIAFFATKEFIERRMQK